MDIFGVGPAEFFLVVIVALIFMGPKEMVKAGKSLGRFLRKIVLSEEWRTIQEAGKQIQQMPTRLIREAGIEEIKRDLGDLDPRRAASLMQEEGARLQKDISAWITPPSLSEKIISPDEQPGDGSQSPHETGSTPYQTQ